MEPRLASTTAHASDNADELKLNIMLREAHVLASKISRRSFHDRHFNSAVGPPHCSNLPRRSCDPQEGPSNEDIDNVLRQSEALLSHIRHTESINKVCPMQDASTEHPDETSSSSMLRDIPVDVVSCAELLPKHPQSSMPCVGTEPVVPTGASLVCTNDLTSVEKLTPTLSKEGLGGSKHPKVNTSVTSHKNRVAASDLESSWIGEGFPSFDAVENKDEINMADSREDAPATLTKPGWQMPPPLPTDTTPSSPATRSKSNSEDERERRLGTATVVPNFETTAPGTRWEILSTANEGDDDYVPIVDYSRYQATTESNKPTEAKGGTLSYKRKPFLRQRQMRRRENQLKLRRRKIMLLVFVIVAAALLLVRRGMFEMGKGERLDEHSNVTNRKDFQEVCNIWIRQSDDVATVCDNTINEEPELTVEFKGNQEVEQALQTDNYSKKKLLEEEVCHDASVGDQGTDRTTSKSSLLETIATRGSSGDDPTKGRQKMSTAEQITYNRAETFVKHSRLIKGGASRCHNVLARIFLKRCRQPILPTVE